MFIFNSMKSIEALSKIILKTLFIPLRIIDFFYAKK